MKIDDLEQMESEDLKSIASAERRSFLKLGLAVTGMYLGGTVLSLTSVREANAAGVVPEVGKYPYNPHYSMVIREKFCIDCELLQRGLCQNQPRSFLWVQDNYS